MQIKTTSSIHGSLRAFITAAILALALLAPASLQAANPLWTGPASGGDWFVDANWNTLGVPTIDDGVTIRNAHLELGEGAAAFAESVKLSTLDNGYGKLTLRVDASLKAAGSFNVGSGGYYSEGTLELFDYATLFSDSGSLSNFQYDNAGTVIMADSSSWTITTLLFIGNYGKGTFTIQDAAQLEVGGIITLGYYATGNGTLNLWGGTVATQGFERGGAEWTGALGVIAAPPGAGTLNLNGGTIRATADNDDFFLRFGNLAIQEHGLTMSIDEGCAVTATNAFTNLAPLTRSGAFTKDGEGTLTLTAANTFTGATIINAGTLALDLNASLASDTLEIASGAILQLTLGNDGECSHLDALTFILAGQIQLIFAPDFIFDETQDYNFALFNTAITPTASDDILSHLDWSHLDPGLAPANVSLDNGTLHFNLEQVPEPATWTLMLGGLGAIALRRRRRA